MKSVALATQAVRTAELAVPRAPRASVRAAKVSPLPPKAEPQKCESASAPSRVQRDIEEGSAPVPFAPPSAFGPAYGNLPPREPQPASREPPPKPMVYTLPSGDLAGLLISAWLVPSVRHKSKGLPAFLTATVLQCAFLLYMVDYLQNAASNACSTPAALQVSAVYVFGVVSISKSKLTRTRRTADLTDRTVITVTPNQRLIDG